ncbi:hypothetical protein EBU95_11840 [bacterium]|nr:hypothetical protein [bacterium]
MPQLLWSFQYDTSTGWQRPGNQGTASNSLESHPPRLVPATNRQADNIIGSTLKPKTTTVDVVRSFYWTYSPLGNARQEVPKIILTEKRLKTNAMIAQIIASFNAALEGSQNVINELDKRIGNNASSFVQTMRKLASQGADSIKNTVGSFVGEDNLQEFTAGLKQIGNELAQKSSDQNPILNSELLRAYKDLYPTIDTGWQYVFPYFDDYYNAQANAFGEESGNILNLLQSGADVLKGFASIAGALQAPFGFSFQERAKFYNYPTEGEEISFTFPLINTGSATFDDVVRNWQLIFLLLYQNKPGRLNRSVVEPPVIYQVEIPGQKFYPFCYISNISVDFKGSRRELSFKLPFQNKTFTQAETLNPGTENEENLIVEDTVTKDRLFTTIIPDSYVIKITLKSFITESRNFMVYSLQSGQGGSTLTNIKNLDEQVINQSEATRGASGQFQETLPTDASVPFTNYNPSNLA